MQCLLRRGPAGAGGALRGGPGRPPEDGAPLPVQSAGPAASGRGDLQFPALPPEVSTGRGQGPPHPPPQGQIQAESPWQGLSLC